MDKLKAYSILGLPDTASEDDIKLAYRALAQKYNTDNYEAGPLLDDAEQKMLDINEAFDSLMSYIRTGGADATRPSSTSSSAGSRYPSIRALVNAGRADEALEALSGIQNGANDAEWNFLMGSAYYYKGWLDQALRYFETAVRLDPSNREYQAALRNLSSSSNGNMQGNPYSNQDSGTAAMNCACNTCAMMCCMDACCSCCRGM